MKIRFLFILFGRLTNLRKYVSTVGKKKRHNALTTSVSLIVSTLHFSLRNIRKMFYFAIFVRSTFSQKVINKLFISLRLKPFMDGVAVYRTGRGQHGNKNWRDLFFQYMKLLHPRQEATLPSSEIALLCGLIYISTC